VRRIEEGDTDVHVIVEERMDLIFVFLLHYFVVIFIRIRLIDFSSIFENGDLLDYVIVQIIIEFIRKVRWTNWFKDF